MPAVRWLNIYLVTAVVCVSPICFGQVKGTTAATNTALQKEDLIEVKVFQEDDLSTRTRISHDGSINFPLLGVVALSGKTVPQATEMIRIRLEEHYLVNPQVNITVLEHARKLFTVLGQVQRAGTYRFPAGDSLNVMQAIGIAGGYSRIADPSRITVKRHVGGREIITKVDGKRMAKDSSRPFEVLPGDIITIAERLF